MPRFSFRTQAVWRAAAIASVLFASAACEGSEPGSPEPPTDETPPIRDVRVLVASKVPRVRVRSDALIFVRADTGALLDSYARDDWSVVEPGAKHALRWRDRLLPARSATLIPHTATGTIELSFHENGAWSPGFLYPGSLRVTLVDEGRIDVINLVHLEQYVAGVVAGEVWPTFETEAYRAQAIISRTFVLYQMKRRRRAAFDVAATQSAQVYRGVRTDTTGRRAAEAARFSRGIVCTWREGGRDRLFCTYYSSACGGESQSAAIFSPAEAIEPLSGGVRCDYCRIATGDVYRWGPVQLAVKAVQSRLIARYRKLASLGRLAAITVIERTPSGRPVRLRLTGEQGRTHEMLAERFRLAIDPNLIRSTDCVIRLAGGEVIFEEGRGFGHGLGLCQWGMQGQALAGKKAGEILRYYYPGCRLTRVY